MNEGSPTAEMLRASALDLVVDLGATMAMWAADRLVQIDLMRQEYLADAEAAGRRLTDVVLRGLRLELAAAMRVSEHDAGTMITRAEALVHRYPQALDSLQTARITEKHADVLVAGLDELEPELRERLQGRVIAMAEQQPVGQFRRSLRALVEQTRVVTLSDRHEAALAARRVHVEAVADGMAWTHLYGPLVEAHAAFGRLTQMAKVISGHEEETRTLDQIRADVMGDLLIEGTTGERPDQGRGIRATVVVTVPALALLEEDDAAVAARGNEPATVEGLGPIPIERARELCGGDAAWMRVLTHPESGMILSVGRTRYRPPPELRRLVTWRADRCMGPGCGMPASRCDVDHTIAWEDGGATGMENLAPLCRGHHMVKHYGGWKLRQIPGSGGAVEWVSPAGRRYAVGPERRVPVFSVTGSPASGHGDAPF